MRLCSFRHANKASYGLAMYQGVVDLGSRHEEPTLRDFIAGGMDRALAWENRPVDYAFEEIQFDPVITNPDKIICVGLNYRDHVEETGFDQTTNPVLFNRFPGSQVGHNEPLIKPPESDKFDYEGELAVIIGKECRRVVEANALDVVAGYACYNDGSIRDWQSHTHQFLPGKNFAATGGFGPWMVTWDKIPDPSKLTLETRLNGKIMQHATTDLMIASVQRLIAYCSTLLPLLPGDVIVSGTPGGVGVKRKPRVYMKDGDLCEVEISGIGVLRNPVRNEVEEQT